MLDQHLHLHGDSPHWGAGTTTTLDQASAMLHTAAERGYLIALTGCEVHLEFDEDGERIEDVHLVAKSGGRSGDYRAG